MNVPDIIREEDDGDDVEDVVDRVLGRVTGDQLRELAVSQVRTLVRSRRSARPHPPDRPLPPSTGMSVSGRRWPAAAGIYRNYLSRVVVIHGEERVIGDLTVEELEKAIAELLSDIAERRAQALEFRRLVEAMDAAGVDTVAALTEEQLEQVLAVINQ